MESIVEYMKLSAAAVDRALYSYLPSLEEPEQRLHEAMHYSIFAGGKRLRPILVIAVAAAVGLESEVIMPAACALEMVHTYSLIHDDLPALDNDDYRRGKLTNHKVFGEATAILAGDALLTLAFATLLSCGVSAEHLVAMQRELATASGTTGMIGGQMGDLLAEKRAVTETELTSIHARKTGALLTASARIPALAAGVDERINSAVTTYARALGLAFQVQDDILDVTGDATLLGKTTGADAEHQKATFPHLIGLAASHALVQSLTADAMDAITGIPGLEAKRLTTLAQFLCSRDH